ncbi:hypothetical protein SBV1_2630002 [Verrucomicrobia bacterium]|nr:hypothetical protein SBV1_2630002 [Verrucomicrobiota bacterium]
MPWKGVYRRWNLSLALLPQDDSTTNALLPANLSHSERSTLADLQSVSGRDFDKAYAKDMVKDHKKDVKEFESAAKDLSDPDLRAWAQKTLPVLQEHLRMAQDMETESY